MWISNNIVEFNMRRNVCMNSAKIKDFLTVSRKYYFVLLIEEFATNTPRNIPYEKTVEK